MLRNSAQLLSRLSQCPRMLPRLAALASRAGCFLHVFVREAGNETFSKIEVRDGADAGDLKRVVIAELQLGASPSRVLLLREVEGGGAPVLLDSRRALAGQSVLEGCSVLVEVLPSPPPPLPPPLPYVLVRLRGSLVPTKVAFAPGADADDLAKAVVAELKLSAAPGSVRLLREVEGGGPSIVLDSRTGLMQQGVAAGCSLVAEQLTAAPPNTYSFDAPLPTPLGALSSVLLGVLPHPQAPTSPSCPHAQALRSPHSSEDLRIEALGALLLQTQSSTAAAADPTMPLFQTQAHRGLLSLLVRQARRLEGRD